MTVTNPSDQFLLRSIKWRVTAGWVVVLIIAWRYLAYPVLNTVNVASGGEPFEPLPEIEWTDVLAIIGLPIGGSFADRMNEGS